MDSNEPLVDTPDFGEGRPPMKTYAEGDTLARHYKVHRMLGSGSGGVVLLCTRHDEPEAPIAIKVPYIPSLKDNKDLVRFHSEGRAARRIQSPFVVRTYDLLLDDGIFAIIMEYVPGLTLSKYLQENKQDAYDQAWRILIQIALGLEAIHLKQVIHRDLTTSNVMLDQDLTCKIADFGVAALLCKNQKEKKNIAFVGTVNYVSPEVVRGAEADARSDLYSWGVIGFQLLTGRVPYERDGMYARLLAKTEVDAPDILKLCPHAPKRLATIIMKALQRDPDKRFDSATTLLNLLAENFMEEQTVIVEGGSQALEALRSRPVEQVAQSSLRSLIDKIDDLSLYLRLSMRDLMRTCKLSPRGTTHD